MAAYYNEFDPAAAHILQRQIDDGVIAPGVVDTRSIKELTPDDLAGFTQVHLFAGGGLWSVAARLAGWPDGAPLWTGSCPCQPFSAAGKGLGTDDPRHLWPDFHRLIRACRPPVVMGEQVAGAAGYGWFDGVRADLEREGYAGRAVDFPACSVDAPHQRNRLYWIAVEESERSGREGRHPEGRRAGAVDASDSRHGFDVGNGVGRGRSGPGLPDERWPEVPVTSWSNGRSLVRTESDVGDSNGQSSERGAGSISGAEASIGGARFVDGCVADGRSDADEGGSLRADADRGRRAGRPESQIGSAFERAASKRPLLRNGTYWSDADWIECHDGKARRAQSGIRFLVDGLPGRVDLWRVGGNAIVPEAAAEVIAAFMDSYGVPQFARAA